MSWMVLIGAIALVVGLLLLASPNTYIKISDSLNRMIPSIDKKVLQYRIGVGVCLVIAALFLFAYAYMWGAF